MTHGHLLQKIGVVLAMLCLLVPLTSGTASATSASYSPRGLPWSATPNVCFGGEICGRYDRVTIHLPYWSHIEYVRVFAHDKVGDSTTARLRLVVDSTEWGSQDVKAAGSYLYFYHHGPASLLTFSSVNGTSAGDETWMQEILVVGTCPGC